MADVVLQETNALLRLTGFGDRTFRALDELVASVSSMSVALFERLFDLRLKGVVREPHSHEDYCNNAQLVIDALSEAVLTEDLSHVKGELVCQGDIKAIRELVRVLLHVYQMLQRSRHDDASSESDFNQRFYVKKTKKTTKRHKKQTDSNLLSTQKYGRFVPVPRSSMQSARSESSASSDSAKTKENPKTKKSQLRPSASIPPVAFADVSSVSFAGSENGETMEGTGLSVAPDDISDREDAPVPIPFDITPSEHPQEGLLALPPSLHIENDAQENERVSTKPLIKPKSDSQDISKVKTSNLLEKKDHQTKIFQQSKLRLEDMQQSKSSLFNTSKSTRPLTERHRQIQYKSLLKDHFQSMRLKEQQTHKKLERAVVQKQHSLQVERIRAIKIHQELRRQRIALGMDQKRIEEKQLQETMATLLEMEKARLQEENEATAMALQLIRQEHIRKEEALETFYAHQLDLVKEQRVKEQKERSMIEQAHKLASEQILRETRLKREKELKDIMEQRQHLAQVNQVRQTQRLQSYISSMNKKVPVLSIHPKSKKKIDPFFQAALNTKQTYSQGPLPRRIYLGKK